MPAGAYRYYRENPNMPDQTNSPDGLPQAEKVDFNDEHVVMDLNREDVRCPCCDAQCKLFKRTVVAPQGEPTLDPYDEFAIECTSSALCVQSGWWSDRVKLLKFWRDYTRMIREEVARESIDLGLNKDPKSDAVNHPSHYGGGDNPYEVIKVLEKWMTPSEFIGFCKGNALKYLGRAGRKASEPELRDVAKALWYLERLQRFLVEQEADNDAQ